jgi:hypothetical protein
MTEPSPPLESPLSPRSKARSQALRAKRLEIEEKRLRTRGATQARKVALAEAKQAEVERQRTATQRLHEAFGDVLARKTEQVDAQWAVDRYAELGLAACMVNDLGTIRGVLSDLMKHAKEQPQVSDDEQDLLTSAVAQLGPEAVEQAARKAGLEVYSPRPDEGSRDYLAGRSAEELAALFPVMGDDPEPEPPLSPGKARLLAALGKAE